MSNDKNNFKPTWIGRLLGLAFMAEGIFLFFMGFTAYGLYEFPVAFILNSLMFILGCCGYSLGAWGLAVNIIESPRSEIQGD